jgi:diguanylate cyclase (GGDEF)-like protein/PAS domain S-box-containing protein
MKKASSVHARPHQRFKRILTPLVFSGITFLLAAILTIVAWRSTALRIDKDARTYFNDEAKDTKEDIDSQIHQYIDTLMSIQGLFNVKEELSLSQWRNFINFQELKKRFHSIQDVYFARAIDSEQKRQFEKKIRNEYHDHSLFLYPPSGYKKYFPVEYISTDSPEYLKKVGFDIGSDSVRHEAIERAIKTGKAAVTGIITLAGGQERGFAIRVPVFRQNLPHGTPEERRKALIGFISASFSIEVFMEDLFKSPIPRDYDIEIFDNGPVDKDNKNASISRKSEPLIILYDDDGEVHFQQPGYHPQYVLSTSLDVAGEDWVFYFTTRPNFNFGSENYFPFYVLISGLFISALVSGVVWSLATSRARGIQLADRITADLRENEERFRAFTETAMDGILTTDRNGKIIYMNEGALRIFGYPADEIIGQSFFILVPEMSRENLLPLLEQYLFTRKTRRKNKTLELAGLKKDKSEMPLEISLSRWKGRKETLFTAIIRDISERKAIESALIQKKAFVQLLYVVATAANDASSLEEAMQTCLNEICLYNRWPVGHIYFVLDKNQQELAPSTIWNTNPDPELYAFKKETETAIFKPGVGLPGMVLKKKEPVWLELNESVDNFPGRKAAHAGGLRSGIAFPLLFGDEVVAVLEFYSKHSCEPDASMLEAMAHVGSQLGRVVERKMAAQQLDFIANHDTLTNLPNRIFFFRKLVQAIENAERNKRLAVVMFVDLDQFKKINDTLGHSMGDKVLKDAAKRLETCVRNCDTVARWGGDEFTLLFENVAHVDDIPVISQKILEVMSKPFMLEGQECYISASVGISVCPSDSEDSDILLKFADLAMYRAKEKGRNNYQYYSHDMGAKSSNKLVLETQLRHAIERNELILHYQPFFDIMTGKIVGAEALVRWNHPVFGTMPPAKFIPLAEETGLILPIGEWVLRTACSQNREWQEEGLPPIRAAVNISGMQFEQHNIVETISRILTETGLSAEYLELELTESVLMKKTEGAISILHRLHDMGTRISIDDFGTGYSSLSYLKKFPIDTLKIDRSFIREVTVNPEDAAITQAIIAMARSLKLKVVAEAVETKDQLEFLKAHLCDEIQGFYFSPPLPPEVFKSFLIQNSLSRT